MKIELCAMKIGLCAMKIGLCAMKIELCAMKTAVVGFSHRWISGLPIVLVGQCTSG